MSAKTKIKLVRYPYKDFEIGEVVDLGVEKNKSMVSLQRAVWYDQGEIRKKNIESQPDPVETVVKEVVEEVKEVVVGEEETKSEDLPVKEPGESKVKNELREKIQEKKTGNSFWDKLK